jgi:hypothetical protein
MGRNRVHGMKVEHIHLLNHINWLGFGLTIQGHFDQIRRKMLKKWPKTAKMTNL